VTETVALLVNALVVGIPVLLLVKDTETVRVKEVVRDKETVAERVVSWDAGTVTGGLGDLVNALVVGIPVLLLVKDTETVRVKEVVRDKETVAERVVNWDAATVTGGLGDLVNAIVEGIPDLLRVIVPETE